MAEAWGPRNWQSLAVGLREASQVSHSRLVLCLQHASVENTEATGPGLSRQRRPTPACKHVLWRRTRMLHVLCRGLVRDDATF